MRLGLICFVFLYACTSEPRGMVYEFKMINDTDSDYVIKKHYRNSKNDSRTDTLFAGSEINFSVPRVGSYGQSFGDSLIPTFFDTLSVTIIDTKQKVNIHQRSYWQEKLEVSDDFLEKPNSIKGKVMYTLKMRNCVERTIN